MEQDERGNNTVNRKLDVMIALLASIATKGDDRKVADKILMLHSFGLKPGEIAAILGKKAGYVSKELSVRKKK